MPPETVNIIEAIGKVAVESVAILTLAAALYIFATSFKRIADSNDRQSEAWVKVANALEMLTEAVKEIREKLTERKCPYLDSFEKK